VTQIYLLCFQDNKHFYLLSWKKLAQDFYVGVSGFKNNPFAERGLSIKLINSSSGPSFEMVHALWRTGKYLQKLIEILN